MEHALKRPPSHKFISQGLNLQLKQKGSINSSFEKRAEQISFLNNTQSGIMEKISKNQTLKRAPSSTKSQSQIENIFSKYFASKRV
jgi:hypothetical protein